MPALVLKGSLCFVLLFSALQGEGGLAQAASGSEAISKYFPVCMKTLPGLVASPHVGIDAVEGEISGQDGIINFMISRHPDLPGTMNLTPDKTSVISRQLSDDLRFIAESDGSLGMGARGPLPTGTERLYAFNGGTIDTPVGPTQDQIFVQLWSDHHEQNVRLLKKVGDTLYRCH